MGKTVVITSGGTEEKIDSVRKITNMSSGKLGSIICEKIAIVNNIEGLDVDKIYYICSKNSIKPQNNSGTLIETIIIDGTMDLANTVERLLTTEKIDFFIHSMAVSDYMVDYVSTVELLANEIAEFVVDEEDHSFKDICRSCEEILEFPNNKINNESKISSNVSDLIIKLKRTPKVIKMIKQLSPETILVGFKLLDNVSKEDLLTVAYSLMETNNCDYVLANDLDSIRKGMHVGYLINNVNKEVETACDKNTIAFFMTSIIKGSWIWKK